ncbi:MAG: geranylgeranylglyceryl/heptaprenylglyceryl phosphate synthase, partial [Nanoarchaeota archaeon]|nr:geranylgeranylglyceryl/heptaprenylglyceryl phosphate synthase [Nanoarchaeota archaeon]
MNGNKSHTFKGSVEQHIRDIRAKGRGVFMGLLDPGKYAPEKTVELAKMLQKGGADILMLGGSMGTEALIDLCGKGIKETCSLPLHLFTGNATALTKHADSIYFMTVLNSENPYWISGVQAVGAPFIRKHNVEAIPTAYLIFEPGQTVGWVSEANLIPRDKPDVAVAYALAAECMGMRFVILESGSGASVHVPLEVVTAIRKATDLVIVIAGGVKTPEQAKALIEVGADCIHIGTKIEDAADPLARTMEFAK